MFRLIVAVQVCLLALFLIPLPGSAQGGGDVCEACVAGACTPAEHWGGEECGYHVIPGVGEDCYLSGGACENQWALPMSGQHVLGASEIQEIRAEEDLGQGIAVDSEFVRQSCNRVIVGRLTAADGKATKPKHRFVIG